MLFKKQIFTLDIEFQVDGNFFVSLIFFFVFFFQCFQLLFHFLLYIISLEMFTSLLKIISPLFFHLAAFKVFYLSLLFSHLIMMCLDMVFFFFFSRYGFLCVYFARNFKDFWKYEFKLFIEFRKILSLFFQMFIPPHSFPSGSLVICIFSSLPQVTSYSVTQSCPTLFSPWTEACQASLSFTISLSLLKLISIESVLTSNHLILCHPLFLLPSILPSIGVFSDKLAIPAPDSQSTAASVSASVLPMIHWINL